MSKREFDKSPTTYDQQITLLEKRGLSIENKSKTKRYLQQISYYRLSAYFLPYQQTKDKFNKNVNFDLILSTYRFDRELRLIVFDCIERIEVAIRSQMVHILAHNHNSSHWQDKMDIFKPAYFNNRGSKIDIYQDFQNIINKNCSSKKPEVFIKHYTENYNIPINPPSWMCIELLTIGELSRLYEGLKYNKDKQDIADFFGLHRSVFTSWLHTLTYVRNICAHHARLWNREFSIRPEILLKPKQKWIQKSLNNNQRTFYFICSLKYLLWAANPNNKLKQKLETLFQKYPNINIGYLGLPTNENGEIIDWILEDLWL